MNKLYLLPVLLFLLLAGSSSASHLVGAEISWKYLGSDTFLISTIIERDCNGVPIPDQPFTLLHCGSKNRIYINTIKTGGLDITPVCKGYCTRCSQSGCDFPSGFENYIFSAKVNLKAIDSGCCDFTVVWQACCRNGAITTGAAAENYYLEADVNPCIKPGDNSPVFVNAPLMIAEVNQCLSYTFAASDPDVDANGFHDSLVYLLDTPYQAEHLPVDFYAGYAYNHPILYNGTSPNDPWVPDCKGFHLDPTTGDLMFKATKQDISQVVVRVEEWGKDTKGKPHKKGQVRRDVTFFTSPNTGDIVPSLSGFNGSNNYTQNFCAGQKQCFTIYSSDPDTNKTVRITNSTIPAGLSTATLVIDTSSRTSSAIFCWQPDSTQIGKSYQFTINAEDNNCPLVGKTSRTYTVNIYSAPKATTTATNLGCGNVIFKTKPQNNSHISAYKWTGADGLSGSDTVLVHHYHKAGTYRWTIFFSNESGCFDTAGGVITVVPYVDISVSPKDTLVCLSNHPVVTLTSTASSGSGSYSYSWKSGGVTLPNSTNSVTIPVTKDSDIISFVLDKSSNCTNWDTAHIKASIGTTPVKLIPPKDTLACYGQDIILIAKGSGGDSTHYNYLWEPSGVTKNQYNFIALKREVQLISISDGCSGDSASVHIFVRSPLVVKASHDTAICPGSAATISATGMGGYAAGYSFLWDGSVGTGASKKVKPTSTETYRIILSDGCSITDSAYVKVAVNPKPSSKASAVKTTITQNQSVQFGNASTGATSYTWKFGDGTFSNLDSPLHQYTDTGYFSVTLISISNYGCTDSVVWKNYIHVLPAFYFYIPNAFTPNADAHNDCFGPKGQAISNYTLEVFSRWGNTVYKGTGCWDGTYKGEQLPDGMFIYHIRVTDVYGNSHSYAGPFYLLN